MNFNDTEGVYTYTFEAERKVSWLFQESLDCLADWILQCNVDKHLQENCAVCSQIPQHVSFSEDCTLQQVLDYLKENPT